MTCPAVVTANVAPPLVRSGLQIFGCPAADVWLARTSRVGICYEWYIIRIFEDVECSARVPYKYLYPPHEHPVSASSSDLLLYLVRLSDSDQLELYVK